MPVVNFFKFNFIVHDGSFLDFAAEVNTFSLHNAK